MPASAQPRPHRDCEEAGLERLAKGDGAQEAVGRGVSAQIALNSASLKIGLERKGLHLPGLDQLVGGSVEDAEREVGIVRVFDEGNVEGFGLRVDEGDDVEQLVEERRSRPSFAPKGVRTEASGEQHQVSR